MSRNLGDSYTCRYLTSHPHVSAMDSDSNPDIHDCFHRVEEWSRQIKQWIDADKANVDLANQFIGGVSIILFLPM